MEKTGADIMAFLCHQAVVVLRPDLGFGSSGFKVCFKLSDSGFNPVHRLTHIRDFYRQFAHSRLLQDIVRIGE